MHDAHFGTNVYNAKNEKKKISNRVANNAIRLQHPLGRLLESDYHSAS